MKVLDLLCRHDHAFEGWLGSEEDFQDQRARGLVCCPLCASSEVRKGLSAPRIHLGATQPPPERPASGKAPAAPEALPAELQAAWLTLARHIAASTEDVGPRFAEEARRMHHGETEERGIRGQATARETAELLDEGIAVLPLLLPDSAKTRLH
ncbi:DUF1178 family protein [Melaminivora sp.]|uniref:DUF1178 family protein n=1 Tax=Melaminivora sp. TaxID=1933032 RepID=UPI0028B02148|nr:DUF1178 family protein [Melaminivora sp.]